MVNGCDEVATHTAGSDAHRADDGSNGTILLMIVFFVLPGVLKVLTNLTILGSFVVSLVVVSVLGVFARATP